MKKFDIILIALIALQLLLWFNVDNKTTEIKEEFFRPALALTQVNQVRIALGDEDIVFTNDKDIGWSLALDDDSPYPLRKKAMDRFLTRLFSYNKGPIKGKSQNLAKEFQVSDTQPYARITLSNSDGKTKEILVSPGPNNSDYVRLKGKKSIYQLEPSIRWWLSSNPQHWVSNSLTHETWPVQNFTWKRGFSAEKKISTDGLNWKLVGRNLDAKKIESFLDKITHLRIDKPLGTIKEDNDESFPISLTLNSHKGLNATEPRKSITLKIAPKIIYTTGERGYKVKLEGDPRLIFVKENYFQGLFSNNGGPRIFLPDPK